VNLEGDDRHCSNGGKKLKIERGDSSPDVKTGAMSKRLCIPLEPLWKESHKDIVAGYKQKLRVLMARMTSVQLWNTKKGEDSETSATRVAFPMIRFSPA
jgi:hypothetical protein